MEKGRFLPSPSEWRREKGEIDLLPLQKRVEERKREGEIIGG